MTNAPLVTFNVNGSPMGATIDVAKGTPYRARITAEATARVPLSRIELLRNGVEIGATDLPAGSMSGRSEIEVEVTGSSWFAVRVSGPPARGVVGAPADGALSADLGARRRRTGAGPGGRRVADPMAGAALGVAGRAQQLRVAGEPCAGARPVRPRSEALSGQARPRRLLTSALAASQLKLAASPMLRRRVAGQNDDRAYLLRAQNLAINLGPPGPDRTMAYARIDLDVRVHNLVPFAVIRRDHRALRVDDQTPLWMHKRHVHAVFVRARPHHHVVDLARTFRTTAPESPARP